MLITSIEIEGLRGIRGGRIEKMAPLTILLGANGSGKSTVLEAAGVVCAGSNATRVFEAMAAREWLGPEGLRYWIAPKGAQVVAQLVDGTKNPWSPGYALSSLKISMPVPTLTPASATLYANFEAAGLSGSGGAVIVSPDGAIEQPGGYQHLAPFVLETAFVNRPAGARAHFAEPRFSSALREALTTIKRAAWYDDFFTYLQKLRPRLTSIESLAVGDRDEPHMFERDPREVYPVAYAGDGFRRSLLIAAAFARAKGGVVAIDEPEAFAHPKLFGTLTGLVKRAIADGTQVMFATQSLEFVRACLSEFSDATEKVVVIGLALDQGKLDPTVIEGADALDRVVEYGDDLRL